MQDAEEEALGMRRTVVDTAVGPIVARVGAARGGSAVLLIHGAAGSWRGWLPLMRTAAAAGRPLRNTVAVDLPGWGSSPEPRRPMDAASAADAVAAVAASVGAERWTVVGHSLGGMVALALAARHPEATDAVVLVSPTGPAVLDTIRHPVLAGRRLPWFAGMLLVMRVLDALPGGGRPLLRLVGRSGLLGLLAAPLLADRRRTDPEVLEAFGEEVRPAAFLRATRSTLHGPPLRLASVRCPVRSVRGRHDVFVGRDDAEWFAAELSDFAETTVEDAGHFALAERPDVVLDVLAAVGGSAGTCRRIDPRG